MEEMTLAFDSAFRSERLIYRTVQNTDADKDFLYNEIFSDPINYGLAGLTTLKPPNRDRLNKHIAEAPEKNLLFVMVCLKPEGDGEPTPIGQLGLFAADAWLTDQRTTTIGINLAAKYQNKGYGAETINWALDWAFKYGGLHRVQIGTTAYNERGMHLYERLGFRLEGRRKEATYRNGKWHDFVEFAMLKWEWKALRKIEA